MRRIYYGRFVDFMPPAYDFGDDFGLIGAHIYVRNAERASLRTADYEYYYVKDGERITIDDATILEKMHARFLFLFNGHKRRVLGVRTSKKDMINPYSDNTPQLGVRLDENGNKSVDNDYYDAAYDRAKEEESIEGMREAEEKRRAVEDYVESLCTESTEENPKVKTLNKK